MHRPPNYLSLGLFFAFWREHINILCIFKTLGLIQLNYSHFIILSMTKTPKAF